MNRSYVKNANVINMVGSRVTGYGSKKWNESMQLDRIFIVFIKDQSKTIEKQY